MTEGSPAGGRAEADLGREVLAQQRGIRETGMPRDLFDRELRRFQQAAGEQDPLRGVRIDTGQEITWKEHEFWRADNGRLAEQWSVAAGLDIG